MAHERNVLKSLRGRGAGCWRALENKNVRFRNELAVHPPTPFEMSTPGVGEGGVARRCQNGKWNFVTLSLSFTHTQTPRGRRTAALCASDRRETLVCICFDEYRGAGRACVGGRIRECVGTLPRSIGDYVDVDFCVRRQLELGEGKTERPVDHYLGVRNVKLLKVAVFVHINVRLELRCVYIIHFHDKEMLCEIWR